MRDRETDPPLLHLEAQQITLHLGRLVAGIDHGQSNVHFKSLDFSRRSCYEPALTIPSHHVTDIKERQSLEYIRLKTTMTRVALLQRLFEGVQHTLCSSGSPGHALIHVLFRPLARGFVRSELVIAPEWLNHFGIFDSNPDEATLCLPIFDPLQT